MEHIGLIGLGVLGQAIGRRLLACGYRLVVWNRTASRAAELSALGAQQATSPAAVAVQCAIVLTVLTDATAVWPVLAGEGGLGEGLREGSLHCDLSTLDVPSVQQLAEWHRQRGTRFVHAPVLGNRHDAAQGKLLVFAGGHLDSLQRMEEVLACLGHRIWRWPVPEQAATMKLACNLLLGGMMALLAEAFVLVKAAGVAPEELLDVIGESSLAAPMFRRKGEAVLAGQTEPNFYLSHMRKDFDQVIHTAGQLHVPLAVAPCVREAYRRAEPGREQRDYSAIADWLAEQAGIRLRAERSSSAGLSHPDPRSG
jgi:3-hydroxyisobutyrate dehydrogenase-like beta-hydroxyacid dehydrogenase